MDYKKLRDMVSHRVTFDFDSGAKVVGYIASCVPRSGPVQLLVLSKVQILDGADNVLAKYEEYPLVPNNGYSSYFASTLSAPSRICTFDSTSNCTGPLRGTHEAMYPTTLAPESKSNVTRWLTMSRSFL